MATNGGGMTRSEARFNALLSATLLFGILWAGNELARRHLVLRRDFSQDQLYAVSPATRRILAGLEDRLLVKAYFSGNLQAGEMAIAKARLESQLSELEGLAAGRMEVVYLDPSRSTQAQMEALSFGIVQRQIVSQQGMQRVEQPVFLGLLLRYRGREATIPFLDPWSFERDFASKVHEILRDDRTVVGWFGEEPAPDTEDSQFGTFRAARALLAQRYDVRPIADLASGEGVPARVDVLLVVRPKELHPRAVFEIDQFVQRGGKLIVLVDQVQVGVRTSRRRWIEQPVPRTGLEELLRAWGAPPTREHVWDPEWRGTHLAPVPGSAGLVRVHSPLLIDVRAEGLDDRLPPTAGLQLASLAWVQPIQPLVPPAGVERTDLLRSSERSFLTPFGDSLVVDQAAIDSKSVSDAFDPRIPKHAFTLAAVLEGRFPSIFEGGAPAPLDRFADPGGGRGGTTDEEVLSAAGESVVVVFGDADWIRDPVAFRGQRAFAFSAPQNQILLVNLVDWLSLADDLVSLRNRVRRLRPLRDLVEEELQRLGVPGDAADSAQEMERRLRLQADAARAGRARQWLHVLAPTLGTLLVVLGFGLAWGFSQRGGSA